MCTQTRISFKQCLCYLTRTTSCGKLKRQNNHTRLRFDNKLRPKECNRFDVKTEIDGGTCEMAPEGGCPYYEGTIDHVCRFKGDGLGRYSPDDFALSEGMWWKLPGDDKEKLLGWADQENH